MDSGERGVVLIRKQCERCRRKVQMSPDRRFCFRCAMARSAENAKQMASKKGKFFEKWKNNVMAAMRRM